MGQSKQGEEMEVGRANKVRRWRWGGAEQGGAEGMMCM